jgi:FtsP/CotA-like multicopper oxidase with cupredoxin domain
MHLFSRFFTLVIVFLFTFLGEVQANTERHDETFAPDAILRITQANITQSCLPPKLVVLVNGTSPGPELRIKEGQTYWIRVYNDMVDRNYTMVRFSPPRLQIS